MRGMTGKHCRETLIYFDFLETGDISDLPTVSARIFPCGSSLSPPSRKLATFNARTSSEGASVQSQPSTGATDAFAQIPPLWGLFFWEDRCLF